MPRHLAGRVRGRLRAGGLARGSSRAEPGPGSGQGSRQGQSGWASLWASAPARSERAGKGLGKPLGKGATDRARVRGVTRPCATAPTRCMTDQQRTGTPQTTARTAATAPTTTASTALRLLPVTGGPCPSPVVLAVAGGPQGPSATSKPHPSDCWSAGRGQAAASRGEGGDAEPGLLSVVRSGLRSWMPSPRQDNKPCSCWRVTRRRGPRCPVRLRSACRSRYPGRSIWSGNLATRAAPTGENGSVPSRGGRCRTRRLRDVQPGRCSLGVELDASDPAHRSRRP